jgi:hypothetical protein
MTTASLLRLLLLSAIWGGSFLLIASAPRPSARCR